MNERMLNIKKNPSGVQAYLVVGSPEKTRSTAHRMIQQSLCQHDGCKMCLTCMSVEAHEHYNLLWFCPEKNYTRELLEPLFRHIAFARSKDDPFFLVLEAADFLTPAVGNSLLKSLEEPPPGYIFLLLARTKEQVMETIASRCVIYQLEDSAQDSLYGNLIALLRNPQMTKCAEFQKELDALAQHEQAARGVLDELYTQWAHELKEALQENDAIKIQHARRSCSIIQESMKRPPMPGSVKLFFRNLFMQLLNVEK